MHAPIAARRDADLLTVGASMFRFAFPVLVLSSLFVLVPLVSRTSPAPAAEFKPLLGAPDEHLDVETLRARTRNRPLRLAGAAEIHELKTSTIEELVNQVFDAGARDRRLAASLLGISGHDDGIAALVLAFEREQDPRTLATLALALAETHRTAAIEALVAAIRERHGLAAYEACRALKMTFGVSLGLDAAAWDRWLRASRATRPPASLRASAKVTRSPALTSVSAHSRPAGPAPTIRWDRRDFEITGASGCHPLRHSSEIVGFWVQRTGNP